MTPAWLRPNFLDRMYLLANGLGLRSEMYFVLRLAAALDEEALRHALVRTLQELPRLRTRARRRALGYVRELLPIRAEDAARVLEISTDERACARFYAEPVDPTRSFPVRLLSVPERSHPRLLVALHHSATDGRGALLFLERLAGHYGNLLGGDALPRLPPLESARYREYLRQLGARDAVRAAGAGLGLLAASLGLGAARRDDMRCATFTDAPLPGTGELRQAVFSIPSDRVRTVLRDADRRGVSLNAALLAAIVVAGRRAWPRDRGLAVKACLPVRMGAQSGPDDANRTLELGIVFPPADADDLERALILAQDAVAVARARVQPVAQNLDKLPLSLLPPALFERWAARYLAQPDNTRETFTFSLFPRSEDTPFSRFGPVSVEDITVHAAVLAPPAIRFSAIHAGGRLNLGVSYLAPLVLEQSVATFGRELLELTRHLASGSRQQEESWPRS